MRAPRALAVAAAGMAVACLCAWHVAAQQPPPAVPPSPRPHFASAIRLTTVPATVTDADGRLVRGLPREQFELFEDGQPQEITQFTSDRVPVSLVVLLDASDSMYGRRIAEAREAIGHFLGEQLAADDEYSLYAFNHHQQLLTTWTDDRAKAAAMLAPIRPSGSTAIYDAIMTAIPLAEERHKPRAALLVLSDGADTASDTTVRDLRRQLLRTDLFIYAVGIDAADRRTINAPVNPVTLGQITDPSGGRTRIVHDSAEVAEALAQVADELNSQYLIGYVSPKPADGKFHSIRVHVKGEGYHVRARSGYVE